MKNNIRPQALFDSLEYINHQISPKHLMNVQSKDFFAAINFLKSYTGSIGAG